MPYLVGMGKIPGLPIYCMEINVLFKAWIAFMLGMFLGCLLGASGMQADAARLALAFGLGFGVCFGIMVLFVKVVVPKPPDKPQQHDKEHWWMRGEPPPWDTYRDDNEDKGPPGSRRP